MTELTHDIPQGFATGIKNIDMRMTGGDARLQISVDGSAYADITDSVKTAGTNFNITIPECRIKALITGDAVVKVVNVRQSVIG
jgi:hypothetical protein